VRHRASTKFWDYYQRLPEPIRRLADENFDLLKNNPRHPSLRFKKVGRFRSARIGAHYLALVIQEESDIVWFWIGHHAEYDQLIETRR
jgi:mRNA-degrading endonuclease RelE of RelBE toxin-antitoxin system